MQTPLTSYRKGLANANSLSVAQAPTTSQEFRFIELTNYIHRHELTNALEILALSGLEGEVALFALATLQLEAAR